jgi:ABC-2 type transport system permease protein
MRISQKIRIIVTFSWFYGFGVIKRGSIYVLAYLALPVSFLFLLNILGNGKLIGFAILGGLISIITNNSISSIGDSVFLKLELKLQDLLIPTRMGKQDYVLGLSFANLFFSLPGIVLYSILSIIYNLLTLHNAVFYLISLTLLLISTSSIAFIVSSFIKHTRYSWGFASVLSTFLGIIPPIYYPSTLLPSWFYYSLYAIPVTPCAVFLQGVSGLTEINYLNLVALLLETLIYYYLGVKFIKWGDE